MQRLSSIDFQLRLRELLALARRSNVTFYSLRPAGLVAPVGGAELRADRDSSDSLLTLSNNTDGIAVVNTNDLTGGARKISDDLAATYVLGYYPTNTKWDGRVRRITVRLKATKASVRARREYRAPTAEEMASIRAASAAPASAPAVTAAETALAELKRLRPAAVVHSRGTVMGEELVLTTELTAPEVEAGRWKEGGEVQVMLSGPTGDVITTARAPSRARVTRGRHPHPAQRSAWSVQRGDPPPGRDRRRSARLRVCPAPTVAVRRSADLPLRPAVDLETCGLGVFPSH